jgi:hypothetical protein
LTVAHMYPYFIFVVFQYPIFPYIIYIYIFNGEVASIFRHFLGHVRLMP